MSGYFYPAFHRISTLGDLVLNPNAVNTEPTTPLEPPNPVQFYVHRLNDALGLIGTVAGTTIMNVPPGSYVESIGILRPVIMRGAMAGQDPTGLSGGAGISTIDPTTQSVIVADNYRLRGQFVIGSSGVTVDGFTITGTLLSPYASGVGISVRPILQPAPGQNQIRNVTIVNNFITGNADGIVFSSYFAGVGTVAATLFENIVVDRNRIQSNNNSGILDFVDGRVVSLTRLAGSGIAFYGDSSNTLITRNRIVDNNSDGIIYAAGGDTLLLLSHRAATVLDNVIENAGYTGITVAGDLSAITVAGNAVRNAFACAGASSTCVYTQPGLVLPYSYPPTQIAGHGAITVEDASLGRAPLDAPSVLIADNAVSGGLGNGITLSNLSAACAPACGSANSPRVEVARNAIHDLAGDTSGQGITVFGDTVATIIADNTVDVGGWAVLVDGPFSGFASGGISVVRNALAGAGGGARVAELASGSVSIMGNSTIAGGSFGVLVNPMLGGVVSIGGNDTIQGTDTGIEIGGVGGAVVHVFGNGTVRGGDAGLRLDSADRSFVSINGNGTISGGKWGILLSVVDASRVIMSGNGSIGGASLAGVALSDIAGSLVVLDGAAAVTSAVGPGVHVDGADRSAIHVLGIDAIAGGTAGVMIDGADTSLVSVNRNGTIGGGADGIAIVDPRAATVVVEGNREITGGSNAGIRVDGAAASLIVIDGNGTITGASTGVLARGTSDSLLAINANGAMSGTSDSGVDLQGTTRSLVTIDDSGTIAGALNGVRIAGLDAGDIAVARNGRIVGLLSPPQGGDGTGLNADAIGNSAVSVDNNGAIAGGSRGLMISRVSGSDLAIVGNGGVSTFSFEGLSGVVIDQVADSRVSIDGNGTIESRGSGIEISNLQSTTMHVDGNTQIFGSRGVGVLVQGASQSRVTIDSNGTLDSLGNGVWIRDSVDVAAEVSGNGQVSGAFGGGVVVDGAASSAFIVARNAAIASSGTGVSFTDLSASRALVADNTIGGDTSSGRIGIAVVRPVAGQIAVLGNSIAANGDGIVLDARGAAAGVTAVNIAGNTIAFAQGRAGGNGIAVRADSPGTPPGIADASRAGLLDVTLGAGNSVTGASAVNSPFATPANPDFEVGLRIDGANSVVFGSTLRTLTFGAIDGNYITLANHALYSPGAPTSIDATAMAFEGIGPGGGQATVGSLPPGPARDAANAALEARVTDFDDRVGGDALNNPSFVGQIVFAPPLATPAAALSIAPGAHGASR
jgi:hypothetical protein